MRAEIICIGNEILNGTTVNTNAAAIGQQMSAMGLELCQSTVVGDSMEDIRQILKLVSERSEIVIITGGLGPTHDDITRQAVADTFHRTLRFHDDLYAKLEHFFKSRGWTLSRLNHVQAEIPEGAEVLDNPVGTAPGFLVIDKGCHIFVLPGVPHEMQMMLQSHVLPRLRLLNPGRKNFIKAIHTIGISESVLNEKFLNFETDYPGVKLASLPGLQGVSLRLSLSASGQDTDKTLFERAVLFARDAAGAYCYGEDGDTLEIVIGRLLSDRKKSISVAESCTGGLISHKLTNVPGSSSYFIQGIVAYSNEAKKTMLGVSPSVLDKYGSVSAETAKAMAEGIRRISNTDIGLSVTGIAGPSGSTVDKPVGLVYIGYADTRGSETEKHIFTADRTVNKQRSADYALDMIRRKLRNNA